MTGEQERLREIEREAYRWVSVINSDGAGDDELAAFDRWLEASEAHRSVFHRIEAVFADVAELQDLEHLIDAEPAATGGKTAVKRRTGSRWRPGGPIGALWPQFAFALLATACVAVVVTVYSPDPSDLERETHVTRHAEIVDVSLSDGGVVTLGPQSETEIVYSKKERRVALLRGQAFFDVASDPARPFRIAARGAQIEVIGTRFSVTLLADDLRIAVAEGVVSLTPGANRRAQRLTVGDVAIVDATGVFRKLEDADVAEITAWRDGRLIYRNAPLARVVADLNRYTRRPLRLSADAPANRTVTASFLTSDMDAVVRALAADHDLSISPDVDGARVLSPKDQ